MKLLKVGSCSPCPRTRSRRSRPNTSKGGGRFWSPVHVQTMAILTSSWSSISQETSQDCSRPCSPHSTLKKSSRGCPSNPSLGRLSSLTPTKPDHPRLQRLPQGQSRLGRSQSPDISRPMTAAPARACQTCQQPSSKTTKDSQQNLLAVRLLLPCRKDPRSRNWPKLRCPSLSAS